MRIKERIINLLLNKYKYFIGGITFLILYAKGTSLFSDFQSPAFDTILFTLGITIFDNKKKLSPTYQYK